MQTVCFWSLGSSAIGEAVLVWQVLLILMVEECWDSGLLEALSEPFEKSLLQEVEILQSSKAKWSFMLTPPLPVSPSFYFAFFLHLVLSSLLFSSLAYPWVLCRLRTKCISLWALLKPSFQVPRMSILECLNEKAENIIQQGQVQHFQQILLLFDFQF